jgi:hypothetical protein
MTDAQPTLTYASPLPKTRMRRFAGIVLLFWCGVDLLIGGALLSITFSHPLAGLLLVALLPPASVALLFAGSACYCGVQVLRGEPGAADEAAESCSGGEIICWGGLLLGLLVYAVLDHVYYPSRGLLLVSLPIPLAATATRMLLEQLLKQENEALARQAAARSSAQGNGVEAMS